MGQKRDSPPRGETVYQVIFARQWMKKMLPSIAKGVVSLLLNDLLKEDRTACHDELETWTKRHIACFESGSFREGMPGCLHMAYGGWVDYELRIAIANRISVARLHAAWPNLSARDRLRLCLTIILMAMLRTAFERGYAWDGKTAALRGLGAIPDERPMLFIDSYRARHTFDFTGIPLVHTYGPKSIRG